MGFFDEYKKMGPERDSEEWKRQVNHMNRFFRLAKVKADLNHFALPFILDRTYSRSAITQALHDVEIEKGWH